jgi:hypothetical protein
VRFFFDFGSGRCLWACDDLTRAEFGYAIDHHAIGLPNALAAELDRLEAWRNRALNWEDPMGPGPWREAECAAFNAAARQAAAQVADALGPGWTVFDVNTPMHEDPNLDRYLSDPAGFVR